MPLSVGTITTKVAAAIVVLTASGTALAARTGNLPDPAQERAHALFASLGVPAADPSPPPVVTRTPTPRPASRPTSTPATVPATPGPAATGEARELCRSWTAMRQDPHSTTMTPAERRALRLAAGGEPRIAAFCADLLAGPSASVPTATPPGAADGQGTGNGQGNGNGHGNGKGKGKGKGRPTSIPGE